MFKVQQAEDGSILRLHSLYILRTGGVDDEKLFIQAQADDNIIHLRSPRGYVADHTQGTERQFFPQPGPEGFPLLRGQRSFLLMRLL